MPKGLGFIFQYKPGSIPVACLTLRHSSFKIIDDFLLSISLPLILKGKKGSSVSFNDVF